MTRRNFSAALIGLTAKGDRSITGSFVNESYPLGHKLRDHASFSTPKRRPKIPVVIVGAGIAGLSAAWHLDRRGFHDFVLLEMEPKPGGNSRYGENEITGYPWAAHYIPVPGKNESLVRELLTELGVYHEGRWDERTLCFSPQERLFVHGRWQEGIVPDQAGDYRRFEGIINEYRGSGEFTIPMDRGAKPSPLDTMSFSTWLTKQKLDSSYLHWYMNYACRDDYGATAANTSAWAGIHYFASREPEEKGPLTWPEGNGFITRKLEAKLSRYIRTASPVYHITGDHRVFTPHAEYHAEAVIFCAPTFLAQYIIEGAPPATGFQYSPWLTANLTLDCPPAGGSEAAWDNVIFNSAALGYVNATHMSVASRHDRNVWTWYYALAEYSPGQARRLLLEEDWNHWKEYILKDLSRAHPDISGCVSRIDLMRMGHAMVRPAPGFLFSGGRQRWLKPLGRIYFANSDLSGFSIFEEAQYRGVQAAMKVLRLLGRQ